jgi:hypothetical protein
MRAQQQALQALTLAQLDAHQAILQVNCLPAPLATGHFVPVSLLLPF